MTEQGSFDDALSGLDSGPQASASPAGTPAGERADADEHPTVAALRARFGDAVLHHTRVAGDEHVVYIPAARVLEILRWLKDDADQAYLFLSDLTAVDYGGGRPLEVVYQLWSLEHKRQLRLKAALPLDALEIGSVVPLWQTANWLEREVFDLFGIHFEGHPDLRRILMPENYAEGHPLRKDFPLRGRFSRAEQTRRALSMTTEDFYTPSELDVTGIDDARRETGMSDVAARSTETTGGAPTHAEGWSIGSDEEGGADAPAPGGVER